MNEHNYVNMQNYRIIANRNIAKVSYEFKNPTPVCLCQLLSIFIQDVQTRAGLIISGIVKIHESEDFPLRQSSQISYSQI